MLLRMSGGSRGLGSWGLTPLEGLSPAFLEWKMWPRMCALAEVVWTGENRPGYQDFLPRLRVHRKRLIDQGVNCAPIE